MKPILPCVLVSVLCSATLAAQTSKVSPAAQESSPGNSLSVQPFFWSGQGTRFQQVLSAGSLANTLVRIREIGFRRSHMVPLPFPAFTTPSLIIRLGPAATTPRTMSKTFAANRAGAMGIYFQGVVQVPAVAPNSVGFVARIPLARAYDHPVASGDILLEIEYAPTTQSSPLWYCDAHAPFTFGSQTQPVGSAGRFGNGQPLVTLGGWTEPVMPGGALPMTAFNLESNYPGFAAYGARPLSVPIDLGPLGAAGNRIYVGMDLFRPLSYSRDSSGQWSAGSRISVPPLAALAGVKFYGQMAFADPTSNALGLVTGSGWEFIVGTLPNRESQSIFANSASQARGDYFQRSNLTIGGAPVVEITGDFL